MDTKQIRTKLGLSQSQLARACNTHPMTISKWETGERAPGGQAVRLLQLLIDLQELDLFDWFKIHYIDQ